MLVWRLSERGNKAHNDSLHREATCSFVVSFHLLRRASCVNYSSSLVYETRKQSYWVDHLSASFSRWFLFTEDPRWALWFGTRIHTVFQQPEVFQRYQHCVLSLIDALCVTGNSGLGGTERGSHCSIHSWQLTSCWPVWAWAPTSVSSWGPLVLRAGIGRKHGFSAPVLCWLGKTQKIAEGFCDFRKEVRVTHKGLSSRKDLHWVSHFKGLGFWNSNSLLNDK